MEAQKPRIAIIGGFPRAGTRQFCNLVNLVPDCSIQGEMHTHAYNLFAEFVQEIDKTYEGRWMGEGYAERRAEAVLEAYRLFSKTNRNDGVDWNLLKVAGLKKPLAEIAHNQTKLLFGPSRRSITYFYCLRGIHSNFNSLAGAFDYTVPHYKKRISASISGLQEMTDDAFFDIRPLHLEGFINSDGAQWVHEKLFEPIGLNMTREETSDAIERTSGSNRTPDQKRRPGVTQEEVKALDSDKDFTEKVRWLEDFFSVSLL